jgi:hypothetical protein
MSQPWAFLPPSIIWTIQLAAVVGGHVIGAWAGHAALGETPQGARLANQLPLAVVMVTFTSITLWSLGQAVIVPPTTSVVPSVTPSGVVSGTNAARGPT